MDHQSPHYVLVFDKKRDLLLNVILDCITNNPIGTLLFAEGLRKCKITDEEVNDFFGEFSDKNHAMGWCTDPHCTYEKKTKKTKKTKNA